MNLNDLKKPFDPERVSWRVGSTTQDKSKGMMLAYIDARDVQDRLDEVCGIHSWQCRYSLHDKTTICEIGIKVGEDWVWKADGAGATDVEAEKGQLSDSFKRAAVKWGIGRYLYDVDSPWVEVEPAGRSVKMKAGEKSKLIAALRRVKVASDSPVPAAPTKTPTQPQRAALTPPKAPDTELTPAQEIALDKAAERQARGETVEGEIVEPETPTPKEPEAVIWAKKQMAMLQGFTAPTQFLEWYTGAVKGAVKRLGAIDAQVQDDLTREIMDAENRLGMVI